MTDLPAVVKILGVFFAILAVSRLRVRIGLAVLAGALSFNIMAGRPPEEAWSALVECVTGLYLWLLLAVTMLVLALGKYMCEERNSGAIVSAARRWGGRHGRLWSLIAGPAIIGLVPMTAGALFSAPMVQQAVSEDHWFPDWKVAVNYWFRHVWEYWWPIYPGVIVALAVFQMETWQYVLAMMPFTPVTIAAGYWFLLRRKTVLLAAKREPAESSGRRLFLVMLPLVIMMGCALLLPPVLARFAPGMDMQTRKLFAMFIGMIAAVAFVLRDENERGAKNLLSSLVTAGSLNIMLTVGSVILFQEMLKSSGLLPAASVELRDSGIPLMLVIALLPMLAGLITGLAVGFAGIAFPLVVGLMNAEGSSLTPMATLVLAFGCGYMALMISPVHLCLLLTRDFFSASLLTVYRRILPCVCSMLVFTFILYGAFRALGW